MKKIPFKNLVHGVARLTDKSLSEIAKKLDRNPSEISNVLARRFSSIELEDELAKQTKAGLIHLSTEMLGSDANRNQKIKRFVDSKLKEHREPKPTRE